MPVFIKDQDVEFFQRMNAEYFEAMFIPLKILKRKLKRNIPGPYKEDANPLWELPVELPGYLPNLTQWSTNLTRFGADEERLLQAMFSIRMATERNIALPDIGDRIEVQGVLFDVIQTNPITYGSNLQTPLTHVVELRQVRNTRPKEGEKVVRNF